MTMSRDAVPDPVYIMTCIEAVMLCSIRRLAVTVRAALCLATDLALR